jgi:hypothetical protein
MAEQQVLAGTGTSVEAVALQASTLETFRATLRGTLLRPGDAEYDAARKVWNGTIDRRPALIVRCVGVADVIQAVTFARGHGLPVSIRGGGHNVAGNAVCDGGVTLDLSRMKGMRVDPVQQTARAEAGLTWGEFDRETQTFGLATTGGAISTTGIAGLTLGGGWGWLARSYGLASDNLLSTDVVTADGRFITASANEHPELFWGVRGGGGNFGVTTSFEYRLHRVGPVLAGLVLHPFEAAKDLLRFYREFTATEPDELATYAVLTSSPDGIPIAALAACYNGVLENGDRALRPLRAFGSPLADGIAPMTYTAAQSMLDASYPFGLHSYWKSNFLEELSDSAIDIMIAYCANRPTPLCHVVIEELGGAVSRRRLEETAFSHRDARYSLLIFGVCTVAAEVELCTRWAREFWAAMQPFSSSGVYVNYLGQEAEEGVDRILAAYGPEKYERLVALKNTYDPTNVFRFNQNIRPMR